MIIKWVHAVPKLVNGMIQQFVHFSPTPEKPIKLGPNIIHRFLDKNQA